MIFSHPKVAAELSSRFECAWESVRPVPKVEIDFGNGRRLTRTLNGNVVTYFCTSEGGVYDMLPGLVSPTEYLGRALTAATTFRSLRRQADPTSWVARLHEEVGPLKAFRTATPVNLVVPKRDRALRKDANFNRRHRYPLAREILRRSPLKPPRELQAEVFKDVLMVDLEDPYLGLAPYVLGSGLGRD